MGTAAQKTLNKKRKEQKNIRQAQVAKRRSERRAAKKAAGENKEAKPA